MEPATTDQPSTAGRWGPRPVETAAVAVCAVLALALAVAAGDPGGQLLFGVAAVGLTALALHDLALRPRLAADPAELRVRTFTGVRRLPWEAVERVDVDEHKRYGLVARTLEVESAGQLLLLSRRALGADPRDVADALAKIRYTSR